MIVDEKERVHGHRVFVARFPQRSTVMVTIFIVEENGAAIQAALDDVHRQARNLRAR